MFVAKQGRATKSHTDAQRQAWEPLASNVDSNWQLRPQTSTSKLLLKNTQLFHLWKWEPANTFSPDHILMTDIYTQIQAPHIPTTLYFPGTSIQPQADRQKWTADEEQFLRALDIRSSWVKLWLQIPPWVLNPDTLKQSLLNPRVRTSTVSPLTLSLGCWSALCTRFTFCQVPQHSMVKNLTCTHNPGSITFCQYGIVQVTWTFLCLQFFL